MISVTFIGGPYDGFTRAFENPESELRVAALNLPKPRWLDELEAAAGLGPWDARPAVFSQDRYHLYTLPVKHQDRALYIHEDA